MPDDGALGRLAAAWGADIRGFRVVGDRQTFGFFGGVYLSGNRDTIYLNESVRRPHMAVLGHELVHRMRKTSPELYDRFSLAVSQYIKPEEYKAWSKMFPEKGDKLLEEFMGEVVSDGFMDKTFWQALAKRDKGTFRRVVDIVSALLKKAFNTLGYTPKTASVLNDYAEVMRIAGDVMGEYGIEQGAAFKQVAASVEKAAENGASMLPAERASQTETDMRLAPNGEPSKLNAT